MTYEKLALLRSLATRPSRSIVPSMRPLLQQLASEGYVAEDKESGWMATAMGCSLIEVSRTGGSRPATPPR
jgi:hypothetical protein